MNLYQKVCDECGKPKPILFITEMARAILEGRKSQTRRGPFFFEFKDGRNPEFSGYSLGEHCTGSIESGAVLYSRRGDGCWTQVTERVMPRYKPGDILYVRETWKAIATNYDLLQILVEYEADEYKELIDFLKGDRFHKFRKYYDKNGWQSSIFMPKEASRVFLKVTDVRVERIKDITENGAKADGIKGWTKDGELFKYGTIEPGDEGAIPWKDMKRTAKAAYADLWDNLYKKDGYSWDDNPWVWVYEFERIDVE